MLYEQLEGGSSQENVAEIVTQPIMEASKNPLAVC